MRYGLGSWLPHLQGRFSAHRTSALRPLSVMSSQPWRRGSTHSFGTKGINDAKSLTRLNSKPVSSRCSTCSDSSTEVSRPEEVLDMVVAPPPRISLLDGFGLHLHRPEPGPVPPELPRAVQRLVAYIALHRRRPRSCVAGNLWPDIPEEHAHGSLRSALWRLQRIAPGLVCAAGDCLALAKGVSVDVEEVHDWAVRARDARATIEDIRVPVAVLGGELLPGWYDDWLLLERERLRQVTLHALELTAERLSAAGRAVEALEAAYAAIHVEPLRESAYRTLVRVHLAEGNRGEALRAHQQFRQLLADELGLEPTAKMTALVAHLPGVHSDLRMQRRSRAFSSR
jgi:DNA-binding SARP family transcriptional activator